MVKGLARACRAKVLRFTVKALGVGFRFKTAVNPV